jgi:exodeoxyribonuclease VII large subunit
LAAVKTFRKKEIDVLVIIRGGGSIESLMPFNNEMLVREVVGFPVPVVVGIGHDKDVPLVCLAADKSESTPTAVANVLTESWSEARLLLEKSEKNIFITYREVLNDAKLLVIETAGKVRNVGNLLVKKYQQVEHRLIVSLHNFRNKISNLKTNIENAQRKYISDFKKFLQIAQEKINQAEKVTSLNNPERQLKLGYSIATLKGKIVRKTGDVEIGQNLELMVSDGTIFSEIKNVNQNKIKIDKQQQNIWQTQKI